MKKYKAMLFALPVLACVIALPAYAAEKAQAKAAAHPAGESMVREVLERGRPSAAQNIGILAPLTGTWDFTATVRAAPGAEPERTAGTTTNEMILDDRFLSSTVLGNLSIGGHEALFNGRGLLGYDNAKKSFTSVWVDTLGTGMMVGSGKYDEKEKVLKETGRFTDPLDGVEKGFRSELWFTDAEHYKRVIFTTDKSGKESKLMEFEYSRR